LAEEVSALTTKYDELSKSAGNTTDVLTEMEEKIPELIKKYRELADSMSNADGAELHRMADELEHLYNVAQVTGDYTAFEAKQKEMDELITQKEYQNAIIGG
jgi:hypothetical protein